MSKLSRFIMVAGVGALAIAAFGAPVAAVELPPPDARVTVVQGIPGSVDICVGGKEIASNVAYGKWATRVTEPRTYRLRVFRPDDRTCAGTKIIERKIKLFPGRDVTLVLKLGRPRVVTFDNFFLAAAEEEPEWVPVAIRHAARARDIEMTAGIGIDIPPYGPTSEFGEPWNAGDQLMAEVPNLVDVFVAAHRGKPLQRIVRAKMVDLKPGKLHEIYLVGWNKANYKWVVIRRPWEVPLP